MPDILGSGVPPSRRPQNGQPKIEGDQLGRPPLEACCKMSSITPGTRYVRYLKEFISPNMSQRRRLEVLKPLNQVLTTPKYEKKH